MNRSRLNLITAGILLSLFLASMEGTVVSTAMPSIVGQLGGLSIYAWVFSIYMLTSTISVPIYGKLSDLYGRKRVYIVSMLFFMAGSLLCAQARSMDQLIVFRAVQGLGAGGILPLAFIIIGQLFTFEQRAKMQGIFSGVWGVSAVVGPLIGGFLVDQISWHWVFYINILPGLLACALVWFAWQEDKRGAAQVRIDFAGAGVLTAGALLLLLGLNELGSPLGVGMVALAAALFGALIWIERRAPDPILPLDFFRDRLFTVTILHGVFAGMAVFGSISYVPLFVQAVLGTSATQAGIALMPMSLSWTISSIFGTQLLLRVGYRSLALGGMTVLLVGAFFLARVDASTSQAAVMLFTGMMGVGMGFSVPAFLIAVQSAVPKNRLGAATATIQFSRSIGGALGVSILGAVLSASLNARLLAAGIDPAGVALASLLDPLARAGAQMEGALEKALANALGGALGAAFLLAFGAAAAAFAAVFFAPKGKIARTDQAAGAVDALPE
jgi:EmrB/QacA subfamily drug resistance transporter